MKFEQSFEVAAPLQRVWEALIDVEYVAPCLPGAAITGRDDEGAYHGTFTIRLGPTTAAYNGVLRIGEVDEAAHRATLHARGTDKRGQGGATATIVNTVSEAGPGLTRVDAETDFAITGRLARFGRGGMMEDISNRLLADFARCLQERLAAEPEPEAQVDDVAAALATVPEAAAAAPEVEAAAETQVLESVPAPAVQEAVETPEAPAVPEAAEAPAAAEAPEAPAVPEAAEAPAVAEAPEAPAPRTGSVAPPGQPVQPAAAPRRPAVPVTPAKPVNGLTLFFSVLWRRLRRRFSRGRKAP